jgi:hypothetical protein
MINRLGNKFIIQMGSISQGEYMELRNELEERFKDILTLNKYNLVPLINGMRDTFFINAILPKNYSNDFIFISKNNDNSILFCFGHYVLKQVSQLEMRELLLECFRNKTSHAIRPIQRKWKEYFYHPDGPYLKNNLNRICLKNGFNK